MTHNQQTTTTVQVQVTGRTILDCNARKLPSSRKWYRVTLIVPDNGIPIIEYHRTGSSSKKPNKSIQFVDLLFADKKHDTNEKFAFSIYTIDRTTTFVAKDEATMNDWLSKVREYQSSLYPEFKRYETIFEATLLDKGLAKTMNIQGQYRLALCKDSLDLIPVLSNQQQTILTNNNTTTTTTTNHHHLPQPLPHHQTFHRRHPLLRSKTIELVLRSIRRCGHTDCNFYIEPGRHSQIGEGDLWMTLTKKSTARQLHELMLATMKSNTEDQFLYKTPRSRSGSSSENLVRIPMLSNNNNSTSNNNNHNTNSNNNNYNIATNNNIDVEDDSGYLPMA